MKKTMPSGFVKRPMVIAISALFLSLAAEAGVPGEPLGASFGVLAETAPRQREPSVARDGAGNTVVVWVDGSTRTIFARRFAPDGAPLDSGFPVSAAIASTGVSGPDVAMNASGRFVVTWRTFRTAFDENNLSFSIIELRARVFAADGVAITSELIVAPDSSRSVNPNDPAVAIDDDGDFVVAWQKTSRSLGLNFQVVAQRYNRVGAPQGSPIVAARSTLGNDIIERVDVAMDADGDFVLAWSESRFTGIGLGGSPYLPLPLPTIDPSFTTASLYARRYNRLGTAVGLPQRLEVDTEARLGRFDNLVSAPAIAMNRNGESRVAWLRFRPGAASQILTRGLDDRGRPQGLASVLSDDGQPDSAFTVNPAIAATAAGGFVVSWENASNEILARRVVSGGAPLGATISVSGPSFPAELSEPDVATDAAGNFVVIWARDASVIAFPAPPVFDGTIQARRYAGP